MKSEDSREQGGKLETGLGLAIGSGLAVAHSLSIYRLMDRAGMYITDQFGGYPELSNPEGIALTMATTAGTFALLLGGIYTGSRIGGYIKGLRKKR